MPISYRFDKSLNVVFVKGRGKVSREQLVDLATKIVTDPELPPSRDKLIDCHETQPMGISTSALREVARIFSNGDAVRRCRIAMVANQDLAYGLFRMYQILRDESPSEFRVFRETREAEEWLDLRGECALGPG